MKRACVLFLFSAIAAVGLAQQPVAAQKASLPELKKGDVDLDRLNQALSQTRRELFAQAMSALSAQQLEVFWGVYADYEKEKDSILSARMRLLQSYMDNFPKLTDADIVKMATEAADLQKQSTDLRMKYFQILNQKLGAKVAGRFAHIDDYLTTLSRLAILDNMPALQPGS